VAEAQRLCSYLRTRLGEEPERIVIWDTIEVTVGRLPTQDLVVPDADVSRQHAVFRRQGGSFVVEDLGTSLGTRFNGERVRSAALEPGDVVEIGRLRVEFHQSRKAPRPGRHVRFASELKAGAPPARDDGDRTMLGFVPDEDLASARAQEEDAEPRGPRALSASGSLEDLSGPQEGDLFVGADDLHAFAGAPVAARDLDLELGVEDPSGVEDEETEGEDGDPNAKTLRGVGQMTVPTIRESAPMPPAAEPALELRVEVRGPGGALAALAAALEQDEIRVGALRFRVRRR
jgi:predicted component of type VI protein secretion system